MHGRGFESAGNLLVSSVFLNDLVPVRGAAGDDAESERGERPIDGFHRMAAKYESKMQSQWKSRRGNKGGEICESPERRMGIRDTLM